MFILNHQVYTVVLVMAEVALIYPFTNPPRSRSIFRNPPLGLGYIASYLRANGVSVDIIDCTFMGIDAAVERARELNPSIVGVYSMFTMRESSMRVGRALRDECDILVAGGPLPTIDPSSFLDVFDVSVIGEGELTMLELVRAGVDGDFGSIDGIVFKKGGRPPAKTPSPNPGDLVYTAPREPIHDLNSMPSPARDLYDNQGYMGHYRRNGKPSTTSMMTSRGCPFNCDFCSKPVFGESFRQRSPENVTAEVQEILSLGYERVFFQDDCFTLSPGWVSSFCHEISSRGVEFEWECLSRVDSLTDELAREMRKAGCRRVFFGLESGSDEVLKIMNKSITVERARSAVLATSEAGIETGAFFILGYPGETDETILETIKFAVSLPLDYLSFSLPYPIPGTGLYSKLQDSLRVDRLEPRHKRLIDHELIYHSKFSETKLKWAIMKAMSQFHAKRRLGALAPLFTKPFGAIADTIFRMMD
jgi:anaerobic magnesium-protoporphyrin IX monomethyl ester cyclase